MSAARDIHFLMRLAVLAVVAAAALAFTQVADASYIVARNASGVSLKTNRDGTTALVTFRDSRGWHHMLAWGAVNARLKPARGVPQIKFKVDYTGGWHSRGRPIWKTFRDYSRAYDGPSLPFVVVAKKARNGSYWVLQRWQRMLPNYGVRAWRASQRVWELRLSHFTGDPGKVEIWLDWAYGGRAHNLFGLYKYKGRPYYGFGSTGYGNPTDAYGRLLYLDTYNSAYGRGWRREMAFLTHRPLGNFCYPFVSRTPPYFYPGSGPRPPGDGARYRATMDGPGVAPDVMWSGAGLDDYDSSNPAHVQHEQDMNALRRSQIASDPTDKCTSIN
jgi:hypothetical protein